MPEGFFLIDFDSSFFNTIPVPSCIQNHGYDTHQYTNTRIPFPYDRPYVPYESYIDKHRASYIGYFNTQVKKLHEDYIKPQENGSHFGCRYMILQLNEKIDKEILEIESQTPFSFNVSHYTQEELGHKKHNFELEESEYTILNIDYKQNGMGSAACGPYLKEAYRFNEEKFSFKFKIKFKTLVK